MGTLTAILASFALDRRHWRQLIPCQSVMRGLDPRIHLLCKKSYEDGWIAGSSLAMTALSQGNDLRAGAFRDAADAPLPFAPAAP
jgi:hypothetical protein